MNLILNEKQEQIVNSFLKDNQEYDNISLCSGGIIIFYKNSDHPWGISEFQLESPTRILLEDLENKLFAAMSIYTAYQTPHAGFWYINRYKKRFASISNICSKEQIEQILKVLNES